jgi:hypothetical protein
VVQEQRAVRDVDGVVAQGQAESVRRQFRLWRAPQVAGIQIESERARRGEGLAHIGHNIPRRRADIEKTKGFARPKAFPQKGTQLAPRARPAVDESKILQVRFQVDITGRRHRLFTQYSRAQDL